MFGVGYNRRARKIGEILRKTESLLLFYHLFLDQTKLFGYRNLLTSLSVDAICERDARPQLASPTCPMSSPRSDGPHELSSAASANRG